MVGIGGNEGIGQGASLTVGNPLEGTRHEGPVEVLGDQTGHGR